MEYIGRLWWADDGGNPSLLGVRVQRSSGRFAHHQLVVTSTQPVRCCDGGVGTIVTPSESPQPPQLRRFPRHHQAIALLYPSPPLFYPSPSSLPHPSPTLPLTPSQECAQPTWTSKRSAAPQATARCSWSPAGIASSSPWTTCRDTWRSSAPDGQALLTAVSSMIRRSLRALRSSASIKMRSISPRSLARP